MIGGPLAIRLLDVRNSCDPTSTCLGILQLAWGGMGLLLGVSLLLLAAGAAAIAADQPDPLTAGFTALLFVVFATALALGGWANAWAGRAIRQHRAQGRTARSCSR